MIRVLLFLAIFGTLAVLLAWRASRVYLRRQASKRHIVELEAENARLDALNARESWDEARRRSSRRPPASL